MVTIMESVRSLFSASHEEREPFLVFEIPGIDGTFGLFLPLISLYIQMFLVLFIQISAQCLLAAAVYEFIIKHRRTQFSFVMGYGVIIPVALYLPFFLCEQLQLHNKPIIMSASVIGVVVTFRSIEAMYDTSPTAAVETSVGTYMAYYSSLMHFEWDLKTATRRKITSAQLKARVQKFLLHLLLLSVLLSVELHFDFQPFPSNVQLDKYNLTLDLLTPSHLANAYLLAIMTYLALCAGFDYATLLDNIRGGFYTQPTFDNPLFSSRSPSEFWGKKWNLIIHRTLKYGCYLPARKYCSNRIAIAVTFVASGLLHEYSWRVMFYRHYYDPPDDTVFRPTPGKLTAFFACNGIVMLLERPIGKYLGFISRRLPTIVVSTGVILTTLPIVHWFSGDWAVGGHFADLSVFILYVRKLS